MRVRILGSGTLVPDPSRGCSAHWLESDGFRLLLDCGPGVVRTMARLDLPWQALSHLFVSHFHTDHVGELAYLLFVLKHGQPAPRDQELVVFGPAGLRDHLEALALAHGAYIRDPGFPVTVHELEAGESWENPEAGLRLLSRATPHTDRSMAVRIETDQGTVGYTGDTGPDAGLGPFFRGCDILIAECSRPDGMELETHLTPGDLAELAMQAEPKALVPVHSYPSLDPSTIPQELQAAGFAGMVLTGWDGLGLDLVRGRVKVLETR